MNKIESFVYNLVRNNPALKQAIRDVYQMVFDMMPRKKEFFARPYDMREDSFFGFHDVSPFSNDDTKILANQLNFDLRMPKAGEEMNVGYWDLDNGKFGDYHKLASTSAWNYHKGCRLQWLNEDSIIYNDAKEGHLCSHIINIYTREENTIAYPIDAVSHDATQATSFSYERLQECMPGYGYPYSDESCLNEDCPSATGLFVVDLKTNERRLIVTLQDLANQVEPEFRTGFIHFVTHSEFSKDNRYISFLHRWVSRNGDRMKLYTRMMVYDTVEQKVIELPSQRSGSHYVWNHRNEMISSNILNGNSCHALFSMSNINDVKVIAGDKLNSDGHQTFINDDVFITDTYPDKWRMAKLYKADIRSQEVTPLASIYSPKKYQTRQLLKHIACDLHPRVSASGKYISWDSPRSGKRALYVMPL